MTQSEPIKKDALFWGIIAVFSSFLLVVVWTMYDSWKTSRERKKAESMIAVKTVAEFELRDFGSMETLEGKDGKLSVLIPGGPFPMGSLEAEGDSDEMPQHIVFISAYYIDLHETTFREFDRFVSETRYQKPVIPVFEDDLSLLTDPDQSVVGVSWVQAQGYCEWADKRLPTEAEWEKAARGEESLTWPWGNSFSGVFLNSAGAEDGYVYSAPPGQFETGRSPYGVYDMAGNVAEWVEDIYDPDYYKDSPFRKPSGPEKGKHRVYRGGSWNDSLVNVRTAKRFAAAPHQAGAAIGFRCVMDRLDKVEIVKD